MRTVSDRRTIHRAQVATLLSPVLARYGRKSSFSTGRELDVQLELEAGAEPEPILRTMPADLDPGYCSVAPKVAVAIQESLRAWLAYATLSDMDSFRDTHAVLALGYACCRPYRPRNSRSYNFDVLDSDTRPVIEAAVQRSLPNKLRQIYPILLAMGFEHAVKFSPNRQQEILKRFQRLWQHVSRMLLCERSIVDFYVGAGSRKNDWGRARRTLRRNLRAMLNGADCKALETILDMEAARAISNIRLELTVRENPVSATTLSEHADFASPCDHCDPLPACAV